MRGCKLSATIVVRNGITRFHLTALRARHNDLQLWISGEEIRCSFDMGNVFQLEGIWRSVPPAFNNRPRAFVPWIRQLHRVSSLLVDFVGSIPLIQTGEAQSAVSAEARRVLAASSSKHSPRQERLACGTHHFLIRSFACEIPFEKPASHRLSQR